MNWASTLRLGQGWTDGTFFDSVSFIGGRLATDVRMLPGSRRGFAPSVSGVARTNARVTVTQNGALLYEATVPPGKFTFDDLYPTNAGGDLQVTIHEADGSQDTFTVPYATLRRCGQARSIMICRWAIWMRTGSPGGRDLAKPRCSTASMTISAAIPALTRRQIITRRWSAAPSIPTGARWRSIFPFCGEGQGARLAGGLPLAGVRIKIVYIRYANAALDEPQQRRQLSLHSRCRREHDRHPNDWREMTRYSATLSQQAGSGSLSFNGIWSEDVRHHRWRSYQLGYANRYGQLNYYLYAQQSRISINNQVVGVSFRCRSGRRAA